MAFENFNIDWFVDRQREFKRFKQMLRRERSETLMLIEATGGTGKTWLLGRMGHYCKDEATPPTPFVDISFHDYDINKENDLGFVKVLRDQLGAPEHYEKLNEVIARHTRATTRLFDGPMQRLTDAILPAFNDLDDLKILARSVEANYEHLPGYGEKRASEMVFQLVKLCREDSKMPMLLSALEIERPRQTESWRKLVGDINQAGDGHSISSDSEDRLEAEGRERDRIMEVITEVFVNCLTEHLSQLERLVLLIDTYDECPDDVQRWWENSYLPYLTEEMLRERLIVVIAGRDTPYVRNANVQGLIMHNRQNETNPLKHDLSFFELEHVAEFARKRGLDAKGVTPEFLMRETGGHPGKLEAKSLRLGVR